MKERVTLTIDNEILEKIDNKVDGVTIKNRSHAVELLLIKALSANRLRKAIILAGGENDKNRKISILDIVQDRTLLEWNIKLLKRHGVTEMMICIPKGRKDIMNACNSQNMGMNITYVEEEYPLGTAGSVKAVQEFITESTVICYSDDLKKVDLDDMYVFHKHNNKLCTLALTTVDDPSTFGVALMNGNKITGFIEKPSKEGAPSKLINSGIFIIEPEVIKLIPDGFSMFEQDVFPKLVKNENLIGYSFSGQWFQIRSKQDIEHAKKEWKGIK
ncbi:MAG TPA: nucleotidyltransferase family protein [Alphaproteobacteria bacterium]|nr:nucleotidyltransferase family protein [Alphaproteobacteria bacterium]